MEKVEMLKSIKDEKNKNVKAVLMSMMTGKVRGTF